jgi:hypothetical protein
LERKTYKGQAVCIDFKLFSWNLHGAGRLSVEVPGTVHSSLPMRMAVLRIGNEEWTVPVCRGDTAEDVARFLAKAMNERGAAERERVLAGVLTVDVDGQV